jgi:hypothetical protein
MMVQYRTPLRTWLYLHLSELVLATARTTVRAGLGPPSLLIGALKASDKLSRAGLAAWRRGNAKG